MKCPLCQLEARVYRSRNVAENDDTPDEQTRIFTELDMACMNKQCANYEQIIGTERIELPLG